MGGFASVGEWSDALVNGRMVHASYRKVPSQASVAGRWVDLSMTAGNPPPQYYAASPLVAATLDGMRGLYRGVDQPGYQKHLESWSVLSQFSGFVGHVKLIDLLLYYPFVDLDDTEEQVMDNATALPRYTDGDGVRAMMVCVAPTVGFGQFFFSYVNQSGVTHTSPIQLCDQTSSPIASIINGQGTNVGNGPFCTLASGDTGIRSIISVTNAVGGAGGLGSLVLVKPLADTAIRETNTVSEETYIDRRPGPPRIYDGAFLGLLAQGASTLAGAVITGHLRTVWN